MNPDIRLATQNDLERIVEIYNQSIPHYMATADTQSVTIADRQEWFNKHTFPNRPLWVVLNGEHITGWCSLRDFYGRKAYESTVEIAIYIDEAFQHQGLGRLLLQLAIQHSKQYNIYQILAFIFSHNQKSVSLFEKEGFSQWGLLPQVAELNNETRSLVILGRSLR